MSSILELPSIRCCASRLSVAEYHRLGEYSENGRRTELLRGFIIEKTSKSSLHASLLRQLFRLVQAVLGPGLLLLKEDPLTLADSEPEPDLAVVAGSEEDYVRAHPRTALFVIEIAVTTEELDRAKAALYAEADIAEYWLVLPVRGLIEAHTVPREGFYTRCQIFARGETLTSTTFPNLHIALENLFGT